MKKQSNSAMDCGQAAKGEMSTVKKIADESSKSAPAEKALVVDKDWIDPPSAQEGPGSASRHSS